jgi:predicted nucleic acid-binding protein
MLLDTDVIVWAWRDNPAATKAVNGIRSRAISVVTSMELFRGARDMQEARAIRESLVQLGIRVVPLAEKIGARALTYIEEYSLSDGLGLADALIAATAVDAHEPLLTANYRHFRCIKGLMLEALRV